MEPKIEPKIEFSPTVAAITPYQSDNDDDIDFKIHVKRENGMMSWEEPEPDPTPIEIDEDKFVVTVDGDVILTEPDNIQIDYKPIVPYSEGVIQLPLEVEMEEVKTKNLVLKRKQPKNEGVNIKKKSETEVKVRDVKSDIITISDDDDDDAKPDVKPKIRIKPEPGNTSAVDANTMRRLPWVNFNEILRETKVKKREQVIFDILQRNLPESNDTYYVYHDQETNTFSIEVDENAEVQNLIESVYIIDAKLETQDLSDKERSELKRTRKMKLNELDKMYGATTIARVLKDKLSDQQKKEAEIKIIELQNELNKDEDKYYHEFNENTNEYELRLDSGGDIVNKITAAILKTDDEIEKTTSRSKKRKLYKVKNALILYLRRVGMNSLANALE